MNIEAYSKVDESAKITGVALIPRISRNNNLYTKRELERFDGVTVPLNWEHDPNKIIGMVTFHYNASQETVYYDGIVEDEGAAALVRGKTLYTSIEAEPVSMQEICNGADDCFHMPFGLEPRGLALTEIPGVPETTVQVIENYIKECNHHHELESGADYTSDFTSSSFKKHADIIDKQIDGILKHLKLEMCDECGGVHKHEAVDQVGDFSQADIKKKKKEKK